MSVSQKIALVTVPLGELSALMPVNTTLAFESLSPVGQWSDPEASGIELEGNLCVGTYSEVLTQLAKMKDQVHGLIVIFTHGQGMESFLAEAMTLLGPVPVAGGAAARAELDGQGKIAPQGEDVTVLALSESGWKSGTVLFHRGLGIKLRALGEEQRAFVELEVNGEILPALDYFHRLGDAYELGEEIWNHVALLGDDQRLLHLSTDGAKVMVSANLPASRLVEIAIFDEGYGLQQMDALKASQLLLFGCAGLNGLISGERPWEKRYPSCYIYGEIVQPNAVAGFANLSMSLLYQD